MKRLLLLATVVMALLASSCSKYKYETVPGDPMKRGSTPFRTD